MPAPLISVVIPTRDRPDTLAITLRALRHQVCGDVEIVVQDNGGDPATAKVVATAAKSDGRIRYERSPHPTSQRQSFEFALRSARGEYMSIIGDDDGFCLGALEWLAGKLRRQPVDAVRWLPMFYVWPSLSTDGTGFFNLQPDRSFGGSAVVPAAELARSALKAGTAGSWDNILVYHGMISRRAYDSMRSLSGGEFFAYPMPDIYAHNTLPHFCKNMLQVNDYVSIYGRSRHSAGASWSRAMDKGEPGAKEGRRWIHESMADPVAEAQPWHPEIRTLRYHDYAALKRAESLGLLPGLTIHTGIWAKAMMSEIRSSPWQVADWFGAKEKAPYDAELFRQIRERFAAERHRSIRLPEHKHPPEIDSGSVRIKAVNASLNDDVEGACLAAGELLGSNPSRYDPAEKGATRWQKYLCQLSHSAAAPYIMTRSWEKTAIADLGARYKLRERLAALVPQGLR